MVHSAITFPPGIGSAKPGKAVPKGCGGGERGSFGVVALLPGSRGWLVNQEDRQSPQLAGMELSTLGKGGVLFGGGDLVMFFPK